MNPSVSRYLKALAITLITLSSATLTFLAMNKLQLLDSDNGASPTHVAMTQLSLTPESTSSVAQAIVKSASKKLHWFRRNTHSEAAEIAQAAPTSSSVSSVYDDIIPVSEQMHSVSLEPIVKQAHLNELDLGLVPEVIILPKSQENQVSGMLWVKR